MNIPLLKCAGGSVYGGVLICVYFSFPQDLINEERFMMLDESEQSRLLRLLPPVDQDDEGDRR